MGAAEAVPRFGVVGASGFVVNELALAVIVSAMGVNYLVGAIAATQVSTLWNFSLVELWAFRDLDPKRSALRRLLLFLLVNNAALLLPRTDPLRSDRRVRSEITS